MLTKAIVSGMEVSVAVHGDGGRACFRSVPILVRRSPAGSNTLLSRTVLFLLAVASRLLSFHFVCLFRLGPIPLEPESQGRFMGVQVWGRHVLVAASATWLEA